MKHLNSEALVDLAEGTRPESSAPHLQSCGRCRAELADLRAMMSRAAGVEVPEPSPLFWQHFSQRVGDAVAASAPPRRLSWGDRAAAWVAALGPAYVASAVVAVAVVVIALVSMSVNRPAVAVPVPTVADSAVPAEAVEGTAMLPPDDPALDMVADLGTELDWDAVHDAGIVAHAGLVDRAVSGLSAGERAELGKLLKQELAGGGN